MKDLIELDEATKHNVDLWLNGHYDEKTKATIRNLLKNNPKEIIDSFYTMITFGTGGMRGIMGVGCNRMNAYTVRAATQGLANYLNKQPPKEHCHCVCIGYDSRNESKFFAEESAKVLAANGIEVYLFSEIRPTPLVSFGCRFKNCISGIMVTASHNPPVYNGYKVYWNDGGQVLPPHDKGIIDEVKLITDVDMVKEVALLDHPLIHLVDKDIDEAYIQAIFKLQCYPKENKENGHKIKAVYTSLHGTGITLVPRVLETWGFTNFTTVEKQVIPDGNFTTVTSPNPEEPAALKMGIEQMLSTQSDILLATDPDADRLGVAINHRGEARILTGNQVACICLEHICHALSQQNRLPEKAAFIKTIVTTEMFKAIAATYKRPCFDVLTGFKYIAEKIRQWEQSGEHEYIFGGEESYGYLLGTFTRDKDAVSASALLCEVALRAKSEGMDLLDLLYKLYRKYGIYREMLISVNYEESKVGKEQMAKAMARLRSDPPTNILGIDVEILEDYDGLISHNLATGQKDALVFPKSNVLRFWLRDGSKIAVRPSGTEPKIKLYGGVVNRHVYSEKEQDMEKGIANTDEYVQGLLQEMKRLLLS